MALIDGNHIIQTFSSNRSNQPLTEGVCLRCPDRRFDGGNPEVLDRLVELRRKGGMSIVNEEAIGVVARNASRNCCRVQSAVGCSVTLQ